MKINTKVVFEWDSDTKQYKEVYSEGYEYEGEVDFLQKKSAYYPGRDAKAMGDLGYDFSKMSYQERERYTPVSGLGAAGYMGRLLDPAEWEKMGRDKIDWTDIPMVQSFGGPNHVARWESTWDSEKHTDERLDSPQKVVTVARNYLRKIEKKYTTREHGSGAELIQMIRDEMDYGSDRHGGNPRVHWLHQEDRDKVKQALELQEQFPELWDLTPEQESMMDNPPKHKKMDIRRSAEDKIIGSFLEADNEYLIGE